MGVAITSTGASFGVPGTETDAVGVSSSNGCVLKRIELISKVVELRVKHNEHTSKSTLNFICGLTIGFWNDHDVHFSLSTFQS